MVGTIEMDDLDDMEVPQFMDTLNIIFTYIYMCVCVEISTYFQNTFTLKELFALTCCRSMVGPQTWMLPPRGKLT